MRISKDLELSLMQQFLYSHETLKRKKVENNENSIESNWTIDHIRE